ncbi:MAG: efflux transporter outer membrane subunit [Pseudomonadota bacterium]
MNKRLLSASVLVGVLSACASKRAHYDTPEVALPASFRSTAKVAEDPLRHVSPLKSVLPDWWRLLDNPELNELVDRALANNHELRIAANRIEQARARADQARADRLPTLSLPYSANIAAPGEGTGLRVPGTELTSKRTYQANVRADWRPDLWGEVQAQYESADLQVWRATFARDDIQRALIANVVSTYVNYLSLCDRLRIAEESETLLSDLLSSVRIRMDSGDATIIDFEQQRAAVFQVRATIPQILLQRDQASNRLASLAGTLPAAMHLAERGLDTLSYPVVATGLPSALLLRRPDVRGVEATMLAADANIDVARARMFPSLDISAQAGVGGFQFSQLLQPASLFWSGLAGVTAIIFDGGKRNNDITIARSVHQELVETYVQTLYDAVREVEDAQASIASIAKRLTLQQESVAAASSAWSYSRESYEAGAIDYMVLLDTERTYHSRLDELNRVRLENFLAVVELFQAIGGGVDTSASLPGKGKRPAPPPEVEVGLVQSINRIESPAVTFAPTRLVDGFGKRWLAELPGLASYASVLAARRDLYARFPDLMTRQRIVLVRQDVRGADAQNHERAALYRLFVGAFPDAASSEDFCAVLKTQFMRCKALPNSASEFAASGKWMQLSQADPAPDPAPGAPAAPGRRATGAPAPALPQTLARQGAPESPMHGPTHGPTNAPMNVPMNLPTHGPVTGAPNGATNARAGAPSNSPASALRYGPAHTLAGTTAPASARRLGPPEGEPAPAHTAIVSRRGPPAFEPGWQTLAAVASSQAPLALPGSAPAAPAPLARAPQAPARADAARAAPTRPAARRLGPRDDEPAMPAAPVLTASRTGPPESEPAGARTRLPVPVPVTAPSPRLAAMPARDATPPLTLQLLHALRPFAAPAQPLRPRTAYSVQVYALAYAGRFTQDAVQGLRKRFAASLRPWQEKGYQPYLYKADMPDENVVIAIRIGAFARSEDAALLAAQIRARDQAVVAVLPVELHGDGQPMTLEAHLPLVPSLTMIGAR